MGLHGSDTAELALDDVEVPDDAMLGEVGDGFKIAMSALDSGRYSVAAGCVGICQGCVDASVAYAKEREQFGRPIASFQLVQAMIADMVVETEAARMLVWRAGLPEGPGQPITTETSIAKLYATEAAVDCANMAIQVHGGSGYVDDHPVERYFRDVRVTTLYEGTSQIQKLIIGRAATGINALVPQRRGAERRRRRRRRHDGRRDRPARRASAGARTLLHDPVPEALERGVERAARGPARRAPSAGAGAPTEADAAAARLEAVDDARRRSRRASS